MARTAAAPLRAAALLAALSASGCVLPAVVYRSGRPLEAADVAQLAPGRTTKQELFDRLGPPWAVAAPGEVAAIEAPSAMGGRGGLCATEFGGAYRVDTAAWFEPFAARRPLRDGHRVYYWYAWRAGGWNWYLLLIMVAACSNEVHEVWVLVDEDTGLVEDVAYRG